MNGPIADRYGRKIDMMLAVAIFVVGSAVQAGAINIAMLFVGKKPFKHKIWTHLTARRKINCWLGSGDVDNGHSTLYFRSIAS